VRRAGLMTHCECCVDCLFLYHVTGVVKTETPSPAGIGTGLPIYTGFLVLNPQYPEMLSHGLVIGWMVRTHHHLHRHHLPSATLLGDRVSSSFFLVVFFSGGLPFALYLVRLRAIVELSF
jgi:hypothetical protein